MTITVPTAAITAANSVLRPSNRNESDRFNAGAHPVVSDTGWLFRTTRNA